MRIVIFVALLAFLATIPHTKTAIAFEGEDGAGGEIKLSVPGTDVAALARLLTLRGRMLLVTVAPQQSALLPVSQAAPDDPAFPQDPLFQASVEDQAALVTTLIEQQEDALKAIVGPDGSRVASISVAETRLQRPRQVRRGLIPRGGKKAKR